jgi:ferredoxin-NADP reductase
MNTDLQIDTHFYKVLDIRVLTENTFILSLPKARFEFTPGQHVSLSIKGDYQSREYSIYSSDNSENLEVLVKEVEGGYFSPKLKHLKPGDLVEVHGPFGKFGLDTKKTDTHKHIFIASGTGIAPFHSMVKSFPGIDYLLIHGIRFIEEAYECNEYEKSRYLSCTTRDELGNYKGRLTEYLKTTEFGQNSCFYLCGNSEMIFDAMDILKNKGFTREDLNVEVYF